MSFWRATKPDLYSALTSIPRGSQLHALEHSSSLTKKNSDHAKNWAIKESCMLWVTCVYIKLRQLYPERLQNRIALQGLVSKNLIRWNIHTTSFKFSRTPFLSPSPSLSHIIGNVHIYIYTRLVSDYFSSHSLPYNFLFSIYFIVLYGFLNLKQRSRY